MLVITATDQAFGDLPYRSGQVISRSEQRFGRWEVRAKLPTSQGMWPAIWLLPDTSRHAWPSGGEIDIMENRGNQPRLTSSAFHYGSNPPYNHQFVYSEQRTSINGDLANYHDSFHTYSVDWTDRYLRFYVDDVHHYTVYDEDVGGFLSQNTQPMQLVINNAIGGTFLPDPDGSTQWPQRMEVDWVRVYDLGEGPGEATFLNGGFEQGGGSLAGWSIFGVDSAQIQSVQASREAVQDGSAALKLFGTFGSGNRYSGVTQGLSVSAGDAVTASASSLVRSQDSIRGTGNRALLKIEFYDEFGSKYGDGLLEEHEVLIADGSTGNDTWREASLEAIAPNGASEARLAIVFDQPASEGGAVHVDSIEFGVAAPTMRGDFNGDGVVDAADYTLWRDSNGSTGEGLPADGNDDGRVDQADFEIWRSTFGESPSASSVPEPTSSVFAASAVMASLLLPSRRNEIDIPTIPSN